MRYLILTTSHGMLPTDQVMSNELVGALQLQGHVVDVLLLKWQGESAEKTKLERGPLGENVLFSPAAQITAFPAIFQRLAKWAISPWRAARAYREQLSSQPYDVVVAFTPAMLFHPVLRSLRASKALKILFIHDFFPLHHYEIGLVPRSIKGLLHRLEENAIAEFDIIYCNLPSNVDYLRSHYRLSSEQLVSWTPLWTGIEAIEKNPRDSIRERYNLPLDRPIAVFGGQLTEGRGIEDMIAAAKSSHDQGGELLFLFIGNGRMASKVDEYAKQPGDFIRRIGHVPRGDFLQLISACDVGMAATVPGVTSHSFPTKIMDYLRVGIPAVVSVEPRSSLAKMLVDAGVGLSVPFGDITGLLSALKKAVHDSEFRGRVPNAAHAFLQEVLAVEHVPIKIAEDIARFNEANKVEIT